MAIALQSTAVLRRLDQFERLVVVLLYIFLVYRFADAISANPLNLVYLVTEAVVMIMVLVRRSTTQISAAPRDWFVAFAGTFASMMVMPGTPVPGFSQAAPALLYSGIAISFAAKLALRRSFGLVAANRGLKTTGLYAAVRHPMYLGYFLIQSGMLMINFSLWNAALLSIWAALQIFRINAEERVLSQDPVYAAHMQKVGYRLVPFVY